MRNNDWTKILGWPGYRVYRSEIDEDAKTLFPGFVTHKPYLRTTAQPK